MPAKTDTKDTREEKKAQIVTMMASAGEVIRKYGTLLQNGATDHNQAINLARQLFSLSPNYTTDDLKRAYWEQVKQFKYDYYRTLLDAN